MTRVKCQDERRHLQRVHHELVRTELLQGVLLSASIAVEPRTPTDPVLGLDTITTEPIDHFWGFSHSFCFYLGAFLEVGTWQFLGVTVFVVVFVDDSLLNLGHRRALVYVPRPFVRSILAFNFR